MIPPSMANHPDVVALDATLRLRYADELSHPSTAALAEERILSEVTDLEMTLLMKMPDQGDVFW